MIGLLLSAVFMACKGPSHRPVRKATKGESFQAAFEKAQRDRHDFIVPS